MLRRPLVSPADGTKPMRPWEKITTSNSTREATPPDSEIPSLAEDDPDIDASAIFQSTPCEILGSFHDALEKNDAVAAEHPVYSEANNLVLDLRTKCPRLKKRKILILCGGPNDREVSLYNLFIAAGFECVNYGRLNGQQFDLVDDVVKDEILRDIAAGEYVAAFASPECSTFSKLHNFLGPHLSERWTDPKDMALLRTTRNRKRR